MAARFNISFFRQLQAICLYIKINLEQLKLLNNNVSINLHSAGIILKFPLLFVGTFEWRRKFIQSSWNNVIERKWKLTAYISFSSLLFFEMDDGQISENDMNICIGIPKMYNIYYHIENMIVGPWDRLSKVHERKSILLQTYNTFVKVYFCVVCFWESTS